MEPGDRCICQEDDWYNAFGETDFSVHCGMRLTVLSSKHINGARFYSFEETPDDNFYLSLGFKPLRSFN